MDSLATRTLPFVYKYKNHEGQDCESRLDVTFPFDQEDLESCVTQLISQMDPMMRILDENISRCLLKRFLFKKYTVVFYRLGE